MNIDDLKNSFQSLAYKGDENVNLEFTRKVEGIVERVRKEDRRDKMILAAASILMVTFAAIYAIVGIMEYIEKPNSSAWWGYGLYVLGILSVLPIFRYKYKKIGASDYNAPVAQFIADVEKKFAFFPKEYAIALIPFLILSDVSLVYIRAGAHAPTLTNVLEGQITLILGVGIGLIVAAIMWYTQKLPILEELRAIKASITK